ncbi:MAG: hypothetical protein WAL22_11020, partial [Solirubrobacteraceae bacterium]
RNRQSSPPERVFTKSVCLRRDSSRRLDAGGPRIAAMDIVAIALGLLAFLLLLALIEGIDRI